MNKAVTDFLTPRSSFLTGMGSLLNIAGSYYVYNVSRTPEQADARALASDWAVVGQDMKDVFRQEAQAHAAREQKQLKLAL